MTNRLGVIPDLESLLPTRSVVAEDLEHRGAANSGEPSVHHGSHPGVIDGPVSLPADGPAQRAIYLSRTRDLSPPHLCQLLHHPSLPDNMQSVGQLPPGHHIQHDRALAELFEARGSISVAMAQHGSTVHTVQGHTVPPHLTQKQSACPKDAAKPEYDKYKNKYKSMYETNQTLHVF